MTEFTDEDIAAALDDARPQDGAALLDDVERFVSRFVAYPSEAARVAHVLWIAHTWFLDNWDSTPRIAFLSPEPGSGKSRALEVTEPLVPRPVHAVNTTPAYLFRKVSDDAGPPTILYDEIDTVFGPKAKDNEDVRGMLNAGHRKGAMAGRCVMRGKTVETEELPAYCAVALAGLDDLPDTIMTRSVVVRMRRRAPGEQVEPWRMRINGPEAEKLQERLRAWSNDYQHAVTWPEIPEGIEDRNADVWEALLAVADLAGGEWPARARVSAVSLVTQSSDRAGSLGVMLLRDLRAVFGDAEKLPTETILEKLHDVGESPWADLRGKPLDARGLARRLSKYDVKPTVFRDGHATVRGYLAADLADPWSRYVVGEGVTAVTSVTHSSGAMGGDVSPDTQAPWELAHTDEWTLDTPAGQSPRNDVTSETSETAAPECPGATPVTVAPNPRSHFSAELMAAAIRVCGMCDQPLAGADLMVGAVLCGMCELAVS